MTKVLIKMIPEKGKPVLWEELSWKDIESLTKTMNMVIMPIGACEQHGPHLPLAVDTIDCYEIAKRVSGKTGVPVVPPMMYMVVHKVMVTFQEHFLSDQKP
jgi:creatinine amidohydrolase